MGHPTCAVTEPPASPPSPHADRSTAGLRVPLRPTGAGDGGGCGPWARGVGHRCAASPLRGDGLLISTQIGVLSGDYHRVLPGYRSAPTFAPRLRAPTLPCVRRAERGGAVPNLFASPPHSSCKKKKTNPTLNSFKRFFKSELEPMWHFCGWDLAWAQQSRDVEEALSLSGPAGWGRGLGCSRGSGAALRPPDPQPCTVLSGSEHCSAFHTICSELSGPECGDSGSCVGSEPTPALLYGDSLQPVPRSHRAAHPLQHCPRCGCGGSRGASVCPSVLSPPPPCPDYRAKLLPTGTLPSVPSISRCRGTRGP